MYLLVTAPPVRTTKITWTVRRAVTTRKMIALTLLRVLPVFCSDTLELLISVAPTIPRATAAIRARRIRCLFEVILEIGLLIERPPRISLRNDKKKEVELAIGDGPEEVETHRSRTRV